MKEDRNRERERERDRIKFNLFEKSDKTFQRR